MKYPTFYFVAHKGKAFVYREHYASAADMNAAAYEVNRFTGCLVCTITRTQAPKLAFYKRRGRYPGLHIVSQKGQRAFAV